MKKTNRFGKYIALPLMFALVTFASARFGQSIPDSTAKFEWKPLAIGAGGWVVGFVANPRSATTLYARTDVGNAYRWDSTLKKWAPLKVLNADGSGFPSSVITAPGPGGIQAVATDPSNPHTVYMAAPNNHSADVGVSTGINIYRSSDQGKTFKAGKLNVPGDPNDNWRMLGERLAVDPNNSKVVYFGSGFGPGSSTGSGLFRSVDMATTWSSVAAAGAFSPTDNIVNVLFDGSSGKTTGSPFGAAVGAVTKNVWVRGGHMVSGQFWSDVYRSQDGGVTWKNVSQGLTIAGKVGRIYLDAGANLYALHANSKTVWKCSAGAWTSFNVGGGDLVNGLAIDPKNGKRIFAICQDASTARSLDGGKTWVNFGRLQYANKFSWLPQIPGNAEAWGYRSTGGIDFDAAGNLWICQGNEGMLRYAPSAQDVETSAKPPLWTIQSTGIEELVSQDVLVPKGGHDTVYTAVEDATGMVVTHPDAFDATQIPLQTSLISQGSQVSACPNDPNTVVVSSSNVYALGKNESGITFDAGKTWSKFAGVGQFTDGNGTHDLQAGSIAISRRGNWKAGADHLVQLPVFNFVPVYSKDGGKTWKPTTSFPTEPNGVSFKNNAGYQGFWIFALKQRMLYADPFVPDKFYLKLVSAPAPLYVSVDGGQTWTGLSGAALPQNTHHGQLAVNPLLANDLWFVDGWEGASAHGIYHSTNGGKSFVKSAGITNAITVAVGAGSGQKGDVPYSIYFYGKFAADPKWGVFRSTNAGTSWDRIAYFPAGIVDQPTCMAASADTFGNVYIGFGGNSYVYAKLRASKTP